MIKNSASNSFGGLGFDSRESAVKGEGFMGLK